LLRRRWLPVEMVSGCVPKALSQLNDFLLRPLMQRPALGLQCGIKLLHGHHRKRHLHASRPV